MVWCAAGTHRLGRSNLAALGLLSLAGTLAAAYAAAAGSGVPKAGGSEARLRELMTQRYEVLQRMVKNEQVEVEAGRAEIAALQNLTASMYRAQADLCTTVPERAKVYEKLVEVVTSQEKIVERQAEVGMAVGVQLAQSKLVMLNAQIDLERLRLGQATPQP
jgi:succinate dehydrogenase/fumarate reductase flavoprotein subunit